MFYKSHFKTILKVLLLSVITFVLVGFFLFNCKPNSSIIEGARGKRRRRPRRRRSRRRKLSISFRSQKKKRKKKKKRARAAARGRAQESNNQHVQQESNNQHVQHQIQNQLLNIPGPPNSMIKATHGICLDASQRSRNGGKVHMWNCNPNNKNQQWNYNSDTKQIKATHGLCLDASQRNNRGGKVHMWNCNPNNKNQQWDYNSSTRQIKATHGKCLDASQRSQRGGKVHMWDCNPNNKNQQWELNSQQSQVSSTNPPNTLQVSSCAVPYSGKLQLSETLGIFNIFGEDKIVQCNNQTPELVSAKKTELPSEINLTNQSGNEPHIKYNDTVKLCNKIYHIKNKDNSNSNEKIKYGDVAKFVPSNTNDASFLVTFNPNVYGESNVKNLKYSDFSELYGTQYEHCSDSNNVASIAAK